MALTSIASTRVLYNQNFETVTDQDLAAAGWTYGGASIKIASDEFGKFLEMSLGQNNGRTGQGFWGQDIFMKDGQSVLEADGTYDLSYEFNIVTGSNNQYNGCMTIFTNHAGVANQPYRNPWSPAGYWQNFLFDMSQVNGAAYEYAVNGGTIETKNEEGVTTYDIDYSDPTIFSQNTWYRVDLHVNTIDRTVEYTISDTVTGDEIKGDTYTVPENDVNGDPISMFAEGLWIMTARYQTTIQIDNVTISMESDADFANAPTIVLSRVGQTADEELNLNLRAYTITFAVGETLHVTGTDGKEETVEYDDCEGVYPYETTTSGTLKAYTTYGTATSEVIEVTVDCAPIVLPTATATISAVQEGYAKTYTLTVDNSKVPLNPALYLSYEFTGKSGEKTTGSDLVSGSKVSVTEEGTLKITTERFGYESASTTVENDLKFETKKAWDFARMTEEQVKAAGFPDWTITNTGATSGFTNWTGRKRLYYNIAGSEHENEDGDIIWDQYLPFGFVSEDNTDQVLKSAVIDRAAIPETKKSEYFEGLTIFPERGKVDEGGLPNVGMIYHVGLYNDQTKNNNNNVYIHDLDATDFVVVNTIDNYGGDSNHPVCANDEEYYAQLAGVDYVYSVADKGVLNEETNLYDVVYALYRIQAAITKITVFKPEGAPDAVEVINAVEGDGFWYTIEGVRVAEPTQPGLYIHNGKKYIVK